MTYLVPHTQIHCKCFEQGDDKNNLKHFLILKLEEYKTDMCRGCHVITKMLKTNLSLNFSHKTKENNNDYKKII